MGIDALMKYFRELEMTPLKDWLYRDFFRFAMEEKGLERFKFSELANWLLDHNLHLGMNLPILVSKAYRVHSKSIFIKD